MRDRRSPVAVHHAAWLRRSRNSPTRSAQAIVPLLLELTEARSVIDIGCGLGIWLNEFAKQGVSDVYGVDGPQTKLADLRISATRFQRHNLHDSLHLRRRFDLALCLAVAERLPAESADPLVRTLTASAAIVYFSAAIPLQGGTRHLNEQWPEYWVQRFEKHNFHYVDAIRPRIWNNPTVDYGYAQNAVLFVHESKLADSRALREEWQRTSRQQVAMIHPGLFSQTAESLENTIDYRVRRALGRAKQAARRLLRVA